MRSKTYIPFPPHDIAMPEENEIAAGQARPREKKAVGKYMCEKNVNISLIPISKEKEGEGERKIVLPRTIVLRLVEGVNFEPVNIHV